MRILSNAWVNDLNTTNYRIIIAVWLAVLYVVVGLGGIVLGRPMNNEALYIIGGFVIACLGLGNWQFRDKRTTDTASVAAKNANNQPTVNVGGPVADVNVQGAPSPDSPAVVIPEAPPSSTAPTRERFSARSVVPTKARTSDVPEVSEGSVVAGPQPQPIARDD
jgi:hypothetical protein